MKVSELRQMTVNDLKNEHLALLHEQFNLRMQKGSEGMTRSHIIKKARRNVARVLTVLTEKQESE